MSVRIGDTVFVRDGQTGVVRKRDESSGNIVLETDLKSVQDATHVGVLNGMTPETRTQLTAILDGVKGDSKEPADRVEALRNVLTDIEMDPARHNLARYVRAEMLHIMNTNGLRPREFSINESKTR